MNKFLLIIGLTISIIYCQVDDILYDWSGQYGVISNNGQLMWNQDWQVGVLLFDGTFSNYPTRFGASYRNHFTMKNTTDSYDEIHTFSDSSRNSSNIDYYRGDFSYDQLEIDFNFEEKNRIISLNGFKRTYNGAYGQYVSSIGNTNPLHQSYRVDYSSKNDSERLDLSVGYFNTNSRLNLDDPADFTHKEKIISTGVGYSKKFEKWNYNTHGALFQQYYKISFDSIKTNSSQNYLNRIHLNQFVSRKLNNLSKLKIGIELDNQGFSFVDSININRTWSTLYGGWKNNSTEIKLGTTLAKGAVVPYFNFENQLNIGKIGNLKSDILYSVKPKHLFYYSDKDELFEKWFVADIDGKFKLLMIPLIFNLFFSNTESDLVHKYYIGAEYNEISNNFLSTSLKTELPLIRSWQLELLYRHIFEHNLYSDGIGDRIKIGLNISEKLFKNNLYAQLRLWADGHLNHNQNLGYEGFHYGPYVTDDTSLTLPDYWVFNLDFSVKVSKMTIGWKVNNILKTAESITNQIFPDLDENYLLVTNSNNFPPLNRFVTMNITWEFDN